MTSGSLEPLEPLDLDMAVAAVRSNLADVRILLKVLADQLADAVGSERLTLDRAGRLRRAGEIRALEVTMGDDDYRAEVDGPSLRCTIGHRSGGIRIRSDQVGVEDWLKRLLSSLQSEAAHSQRARQALERIVIGGA